MSLPLSVEAERLLPAPDEAPRCADHQRSLGIDPGGSAIDTDAVVLVDLPSPWPAELADHHALADLGTDPVLADGRARLLATHPTEAAPPGRVRVFARRGAHTVGWQLAAADGSVTTVLQALRATPAEHHERAEALRPDVVLVCAHGSRDRCCGSDGTRLALTLKAERPDVGVERTSHLGGHRFAPTAMTLASGRMWADVDLELLAAIVDRRASVDVAASHCRGWWGAPMGPAQVAERAVFARRGWTFDDLDREVTVETDGEAFRCTVSWTGGRAEVRVAVAREVPTIKCAQSGGRPAKPATEYEVVEIVGD